MEGSIVFKITPEEFSFLKEKKQDVIFKSIPLQINFRNEETGKWDKKMRPDFEAMLIIKEKENSSVSSDEEEFNQVEKLQQDLFVCMADYKRLHNGEEDGRYKRISNEWQENATSAEWLFNTINELKIQNQNKQQLDATVSSREKKKDEEKSLPVVSDVDGLDGVQSSDKKSYEGKMPAWIKDNEFDKDPFAVSKGMNSEEFFKDFNPK